MSTSNAISNSATQQAIDTRLDAIDRALLGLVPRGERLALVAQVESRILELAATTSAGNNLTTESGASTDAAPLLRSATVPARSRRRRRSRLALSAGVLGIMALVLLLGMPLTYLFAEMISDAIDELFAWTLLGAHAITITVGGLAAMMCAVAAIVKLARHRDEVRGYGWAFTGLCTGFLPLIVGTGLIFVGAAEMTLVKMEPSVSGDVVFAPPPVAPMAPFPSASIIPMASEAEAESPRVSHRSMEAGSADFFFSLPVPVSDATVPTELPTPSETLPESSGVPIPPTVEDGFADNSLEDDLSPRSGTLPPTRE